MMYNKIVTELADWLNKRYLEWQVKTGVRQPMRAFADYLGIKPTSLSNWLNSSIPPSKDNVDKIAEKLGPEIYDILGLARPDPNEEKLLEMYRAIDPNDKEGFLDWAARYLIEMGRGRRVE